MARWILLILLFSGISITCNAGSDSTHVDSTIGCLFSHLRSGALHEAPEDILLTEPVNDTTVYGVVMDWGTDDGTATTVAFLTGDASLYYSNNGGIIGGKYHDSVNNAAKQFVRFAQQYLTKAQKTDLYPLPQTDEVKFYFLTRKGIFVGSEIYKHFEDETSHWYPLFVEANKVITEFFKLQMQLDQKQPSEIVR